MFPLWQSHKMEYPHVEAIPNGVRDQHRKRCRKWRMCQRCWLRWTSLEASKFSIAKCSTLQHILKCLSLSFTYHHLFTWIHHSGQWCNGWFYQVRRHKLLGGSPHICITATHILWTQMESNRLGNPACCSFNSPFLDSKTWGNGKIYQIAWVKYASKTMYVCM